jgi:hypothetical protein
MTNLYKCKIKLYQAQNPPEGNESYLWIEMGQDLKTWEEVKVTSKKTIQDNSRYDKSQSFAIEIIDSRIDLKESE